MRLAAMLRDPRVILTAIVLVLVALLPFFVHERDHDARP